MTLANAIVLHKHYLEIGRKKHAEDLERIYPELKEAPIEEPKKEPKKEVKKNGNSSSNRKR